MPVTERIRFTTIHKTGSTYRVPADRQFYINFLMQSQFHSRIATLADRIEKLIRERGATTRFDREEFYEAAGLCVYAHKDAIREVSGKPYADHPITLVEREVDLFYVTDKEELIAGLLHDVVEDTCFDVGFIKRKFGPAVANLVDGMTKIKQMEKDRLISEENIDKFVTAFSRDIRLLRIRTSDRGVNLEDIEERGEERRTRNCQEALDFYAPLGVLCGFMKAARHLSDIAFKKLNPQRYSEIEEVIARTMAENQPLLEQLKSQIEKEYRKLNKTGRIEILTKPRTAYEVDQISAMRGTEVRNLSDIVMMQIIVEGGKEECFSVAGLINSLGIPIDHYWHDYINDPKINFYQSLHTAIQYDKSLIRFQIRTRKMQRVAQEGILYEAFTPGGKFVQPDLPWLKADWLRIILQVKDRREKILLTKSLAQARLTTVMVEGSSMCTPYRNVLLPRGITPLELAFITDPQLGFYLTEALHKDVARELIEPIKEGIGFIKLRIADQPQPRDYAHLLKNPLARSRFMEYLKKLEPAEQERFNRKIWEEALAKILLTPEAFSLGEAAFSPELISGISLGEIPIAKAVDGIRTIIRGIDSEIIAVERLQLEAERRTLEQMADTIRDIFRLDRYGFDGQVLALSLPLRSGLQEFQFQQLMRKIRREGQVQVVHSEQLRLPILDDLALTPDTFYYVHELAQRAALALQEQQGEILNIYMNPTLLGPGGLPRTYKEEINGTTMNHILSAKILFINGEKEDVEVFKGRLRQLLGRTLLHPPLMVIFERKGFGDTELVANRIRHLADIPTVGIAEWGGNLDFILACLQRRLGELAPG